MCNNFSTAKVAPNLYEESCWSNNQLVCGVDEVGRGCLAGPVVVCATILFPNTRSNLLKDSKDLSPSQMYKVYQWIVKNSWHSISIFNHRFIDKFNIYQTTLSAMKRAVLQLFSSTLMSPDLILVDAMPLSLQHTRYNKIPIEHFPFGESRSTSIAAASILAKVKRDSIMKQFDIIIPNYAFALHKGYQTKKHIDMLDRKGHSIIHRQTYLRKYKEKIKEKSEKQQLLFC